MKAYAISAILKIFAFEIALGRKIDMLPEVNENTKLFFLIRQFGATKFHYICVHMHKKSIIFSSNLKHL